MQSVSVKNLSEKAVSIVLDDERIFSDILPEASTFFCPTRVGSANIVVLDSREKPLHDLWVSIAPESRNILYIFDHKAVFVTLSHF